MTSVGDLSVGLSLGGLSSFVSGMGQAGGAIGKFGAAAAAVTAVVAVKSVKAFAQLESSMVRVKAISNATDKQFEQMNATVKRLGASTTFTANEAAEGLQFLAMAGLDTKTAIDALPGALQLAQAAAVDLGTAADTVTNVMAGYGIAAKDLTRANDTLVATFTGSNTTLTELGEAFKVVGPVAKGMGVAFEDVAVAAGTLGNAGIKASDAGTGLKRALTAIVNASPKARKAMSDLGLSSADASRGFVHVVKKLEAAKESMTDLGFQSRIFQVFGERAGPKMAALVEQGSAAMEKLRRKIEEAEGATKRIQDMELNTLAAKWKLLGSAVDGVLVAIGEDTESAVTKGVAALTSYVSTIEHAVRKLGVLDAVGVALTGAPLTSGSSRAIKEKTQGFIEQAEIKAVREEIKRLNGLIAEEKMLGPSEIYADGRTSIDGMMAEVRKQEAWLREKGQQKAPVDAVDALITKTKKLIEIEGERHKKTVARAKEIASLGGGKTAGQVDTYTPATLGMERERFEHDFGFVGGNRYKGESAEDPFASGAAVDGLRMLQEQLAEATSAATDFTSKVKTSVSDFTSEMDESSKAVFYGMQRFRDALESGYLINAAASGRGFEAAGAELGALAGGIVGSFFGGAGIGESIGGVLGSILGDSVDQLVKALGVLTPAFEAVGTLVASLTPIFDVLGYFIKIVALRIEMLAPALNQIAKPIASLLLVVVRLVEVALPLVDVFIIALNAVLSFTDVITGVVSIFDEMFRALVNASVSLTLAFAGAADIFIRWIREFTGFEQFGTTFDLDPSEFTAEDLIKDFFKSWEEMRGVQEEAVDATRANTEATNRLTETFNNISDSPGYRQARFEAEGARNRVDFGADYAERARILNGGTLAVPGLYSQFNRPN